MKATREIFDAWRELWSHPELVSILSARDADIHSQDVARAIVEGIAVPRRPGEAFAVLLSRGEFRAAEGLLETSGFREALADSESGLLNAALRRARLHAQDEVQARIASLAARASSVRLDEGVPAGIDDAVRDRRTQADVLLDDWEKRVADEESKLAENLRGRLLEAPDDVSSPGVSAWRSSVERCVESREFRVARFLLDEGPGVTPPDEPTTVPRRPEWPWTESPREVLGWFNGDAAPLEFDSRWMPDPEDRTASALLRVITHMSAGSSADAASVAEFAETLDRFLGHEAEAVRETESRGDGFETRLCGIADARLPCLGACGDRGVRLWVPDSPDASMPEATAGPDMLLCFWPTRAPGTARGMVSFDASTLFALMADPQHRRVNFLRALGARLDLEDVIPPALGSLRLPPMDVGQLRTYTNWLFDVANVEMADPVLADLLVYYSGARLALLLRLVRSLFVAVRGRRPSMTKEDVSRTWRGEGFRKDAWEDLTEAIAEDPQVRAVLGAAYFVGSHPGGKVTVEDVCFAIEEFWDAEISAGDAEGALRRLVGLELLEPTREGETYRIPLSGVGFIAVGALSDAEGYALSALASFDQE